MPDSDLFSTGGSTSQLEFAETPCQSWTAGLSRDCEFWLTGERSHLYPCSAMQIKRKCRLIRNRDTYSSWILLAGVRFSASPLGKYICVQISVGTQEIRADLIVLWAQWGLPFHLTDKWLIKKVRGREGAGRKKPQYCPITETFKKMEERYSLLTG